MFPIYQARKLLKVIDIQHGHTQPWVVLCEGKDGWEEFVVKIFTEEHLLQKPRVHGEFVGSWLAGEFDLLTPLVAWIEMDHHFINSLPPRLEAQIDLYDDRLKFGSKILKSFQHFPKGFKRMDFFNLIPIDRLFAFDNFIRNSDRGSFKPNLLLTNSDAYLIDHEFSLDLDQHTIQELKDSIWPGKFSTTHIAYPFLAKGNRMEKANYFDDFGEYLRALSLERLQSVLNEVENQGYKANTGMIMDYFRYVKTNPLIFTNLLKGMIK